MAQSRSRAWIGSDGGALMGGCSWGRAALAFDVGPGGARGLLGSAGANVVVFDVDWQAVSGCNWGWGGGIGWPLTVCVVGLGLLGWSCAAHP
jgi:hypothetical protein